MGPKTQISEERFRQLLLDSIPSVELAARWLTEAGRPATARPVTIRPTQAEWKSYSDLGDIELQWRHRRNIVEVKQISKHFTCAADYPHRPNILISERYKQDRVGDRLYCYLIFNKRLSHAILIHYTTEHLWLKTEMDDLKFTGRTGVKHYSIAVEEVIFLSVPPHLIEKKIS